MYKKILVSTDGSDLAEKGVDAAIELAQKLQAELFLVTVTSILPAYGFIVGPQWTDVPPAFEDFRQEVTEKTKKILDAAQQKAKQKNINVTALHVENEQPAMGILDAAEKYHVDLIVMASHGRRGVSRLLVGSQTAEVLANSKISLLIVK